MSLLENLLTKGYFPSELPPTFNTVAFGQSLTANVATIPNNFQNVDIAKLGSFSLARAGNHRFRRRLSIVNPIHFYKLAREINISWRTLRAAARSVQIGKSSPVFVSTRARAITPMFFQKDLIQPRAQARAGAKLILKTDISDFYHSIYTHSIPWALHTKATAKQNRTNALLGNRLDTLVRNSQDQQTMGLPIGPDTSFLLAELILSDIDSELLASLTGLRGLRFVDDYEFSFSEHARAEECFAKLQQSLLGYELRLNPRKTSLADAPVQLEPEWISELRVIGRFRTTGSGEQFDLMRYFDRVAEFIKEFPDAHVSKYALASLREFVAQSRNWRIYEPMLYQAIAAEPGAIREIMDCLTVNEANGATLNTETLRSILNEIIAQSVPLGHDYEAAWALWGIINFGLTLNPETISALQQTDNSIIALLALDANAKGLVPGGIDTTRWLTYMTRDALYEEQWLLAYEANIQAWLPSVGGVDHVDADPYFKYIKDLGVSFYDTGYTGVIPTLYAISSP